MKKAVNTFKRIIRKCTALLLTVVTVTSFSACSADIDGTVKKISTDSKREISIWYCDDRYTDYLNYVGQRLHKINELVTIKPVLAEYDDYIENIYNESVHKDNAADIYLMSSDELEKAVLLGVAAENNTYAKYYNSQNYGAAAVNSALYNGKLYGYPLSYNTSFMVYNSKYAGKVSSFDELTKFAADFQVTEDNKNLKQLVTWDISDTILNFAFSAGSLNIGSESGDDKSVMAADSQQLKSAMTQYQKFKELYGIDRNTDTIESTVEMFCNGELAYTIIDAEHLKAIEESGVSFGICEIPSIGDGYEMKNISETTMAVVNQYAYDLELSKTIAYILSYDYSEFLYSKAGLLSARKNDSQYVKDYQTVYDIYNESFIKAQFIGAAAVYSNYEIMLGKIWKGSDINETVDEFVSGLQKNTD